MKKTSLFIPGAVYYLQNCASFRYLTNKNGHDLSVDELHSTNLESQQWILDVFDKGRKTYSFIQKKTGERLSLNEATNGFTLLPLDSTDPKTGWQLNHHSGSSIDITSTASPNSTIKQNTKTYHLEVGQLNNIKISSKWYLLLADLEITARIHNIEYKDVIIPTSMQKTLIDSGTIRNNSEKATINAGVSISKNVSSSFSWSLNEEISTGLSLATTAGGQVSLPLVAEGKVSTTVTLSASLTFSSNQTFSSSEAVNFSAEMNVSVPPQSSATYHAYVNIAERIESDFIMYLEVTAKLKSSNLQFTTEQLVSILSDNGYDLTNFKTTENSVILPVGGKFNGSYGINMDVEVV